MEKQTGCGKRMGSYPTLEKYKIIPHCGEILTNYETDPFSTEIRLCDECINKQEVKNGKS